MRDDETYPFDWSALGRRTLARLRREEHPAEPIAECALRGLHGAANSLAWRLDDWAHPEWREASFDGPVFIVGHQRSATTFLHRALVEDVLPHGVGLTLADMLAPAMVARRLGDAVDAGPEAVGRVLGAVVEHLERSLFEPIEPLHRIRFDAVEEDEFALAAMFASGMCANDRPSTLTAKELDALRRPETRPVERQRRTLRGYRAILRKRAAAADSAAPLMVAKNPAFSKRLELVADVFPEARFVRVVRHPVDAVRSRLELVDHIWRHRHGQSLEPEHARCMLRDSIDIYRGAEAGFDALDESRTHAIRFDRFVADPADRVGAIVEELGLGAVDRDFRERVAERSEERGGGRSGRPLDDWEIQPADIVEPLSGVFERWNFERRGVGRDAA